MKYKLLLSTALCVCALSGTVNAQSTPVDKTPLPFTIEAKPLAVLDSSKEKNKLETFKKFHQYHKVNKGDTLPALAKKYKTTIKRLWGYNKKIEDPFNLKRGMELTIPLPEDKVKERALPLLATIQWTRRHIGGNDYAPGNCTLYVKSKRPDWPLSMGNADVWDDNSPFPVRNRPTKGAVGVTVAYMHVVYVEKVKGNKVYISEMNYSGYGVVSYRWAPIDEFRYIW